MLTTAQPMMYSFAYALDELGSDGVTVETNSGGVYLRDARYEPL